MFSTRNVALRLAAVGAAGAVVLGLADPAVAAPAAAAAASSCPRRSPATPPRGSLTNAGDIAVGVVPLADGNCTHGTYDAILYPGEDTYHDLGWAEVAGAYIGAPYWARVTGAGMTQDYPGPKYPMESYRGGNWTISVVCCGGQD